MAGPGSTSARRLGLALAWLALLLLAGWWIAPRLELSGDLRKFMPSAQTPAQKLLIDELGEGPGSRLLLLALSGADADVLAAQSDALRARLADDPRFVLVANGGAAGLAAIPERLRPYRYLLSPTLDTTSLDATYLGDQLEAEGGVDDIGGGGVELHGLSLGAVVGDLDPAADRRPGCQVVDERPARPGTSGWTRPDG
mgnify:CR=1 FL=1